MINRNGFTLIETLVAMMLLAISFVIIMQLFSGGLKSSRVTTDYIYGIFHAREKMEEILLSDNLIPGTVSGEFEDGYEWSATVFIPPPEEDDAAARMPIVTADISVDVRWHAGGQEKRFGLNTTAIVPKPKLEDLGE
jgi:general secretion pathway protein I